MDILLQAAIAATAIILIVVLLLLGGVQGILSLLTVSLTFGIIYGCYRLITSFYVEFEYAITNGEMDIDQIIARRKRKRLATVNLRNVSACGRYCAADHPAGNYQARIFACDDRNSSELWYCVERTQSGGCSLVVFNTNPRMQNSIKLFYRTLFCASHFPPGNDLRVATKSF